MPRIEPRVAVTAYARARLHREAKAHGRGYQAHVARTAKISTAHVANILNQDDYGIGWDVADKLARFWGMTIAELTTEAEQWAVANVERAQLPPNLGDAVAFVRSRGGEVPEEIEEKAAKVARQLGDLSVGVWISILHDLMARASANAKNSAS